MLGARRKRGAEWREMLISSGVFSAPELWIAMRPQQQQDLSSWRDVVLQAPLDILVCVSTNNDVFLAVPPEVVNTTDTTTTAKVEFVARCGAAGPPCNAGVFSTVGDIFRAPPPKLVHRP